MSWIDERVLVHVGLPKTATSWLQEFYFPVDGCGYWIPPVATKIRHPIKQIGRELIANSDGQLLEDGEFDAEKMRASLARLGHPGSLMPVISNERLAGHPLSAGFDRDVIARRIKDVFPRARILVTIRAQNSMIMSNYMQYLKYGGWHSPEDYLRPASDMRCPTLRLSFWDYDRMHRIYARHFGEENVLMLPQELLRRDPQGYLKQIADFTGTVPPLRDRISLEEANPRKQHVSSYYLRRLTSLSRKSSANAFAPGLMTPKLDRALDKASKFIVDMLTPASAEERLRKSLQARIDAIVGSAFRESNRRLAALTGLDLASMGYGV